MSHKIMTHVVLGYPTLQESEAIVEVMAEAGAAMIELQIPFSDPIADGAVIMRANQVGVDNNVGVKESIAAAGRLTKKLQIPILFMCYFHTVYRFGVERFCESSARNGVKGLIVPDLPIEEDAHENLSVACRKHNLELVRVCSPGMTRQRLEESCSISSGMVYCTARNGITGERSVISTELEKCISDLRDVTSLPIAVGFGIRTREQVSAICQLADVAVIGTAAIECYDDRGLSGLRQYLQELILEKSVI